jgi:hypothetical protein
MEASFALSSGPPAQSWAAPMSYQYGLFCSDYITKDLDPAAGYAKMVLLFVWKYLCLETRTDLKENKR